MADRDNMSASLSSIRVAHVMAGAPSGGAELFFERLCAAQIAAGQPIQAMIRREAGRERRLAQAHVPTKTFGFGGALDFLTTPQLKYSLRQFAPQIVVAWMNRAARMTPSGDWTLAGRLGGYYDLSNYRRCTHLIGNTRGLAQWMVEQGWPAERVHYLPNFAAELAEVRAERPDCLPPNAPFVLALGRLHENKAFDVLIRAMRFLPGVHLVIAGEGPERAALTELAKREGVADYVHLPGWVQESGRWLKACDVLVCPSRIEPLGNVVIEAFSAARPVVASAIQGPKEIIEGTRDGLLAPVEDAEALAAQIGEALENRALAAELSANGRVRYEQEFAAPTVLARWGEFLKAQAA
ncbi:glycosyltransferase [Kozakia baliensis]|uniref:Glycosyl transferase n=2 Tax=Kozakia baliensis TaxID=153496 RepID=A0A1D8US54_9PROT|nr:glycosyltransferase [Kozakia baliensis]AOX16468.1 glycosyl transferase [Kozakia baliensis]